MAAVAVSSLLLGLPTLGACGLTLPSGSTPDGDQADASERPPTESSSGASDAAPPRGDGCEPSWALAEPEPLQGMPTGNGIHAPRLTEDELTVYFSMTVEGGAHVFFAQRLDLESPFGPPDRLEELDAPNTTQSWPSVVDGGLSIFFTRFDKVTNAYETRVAHRDLITDAFRAPEPFRAASQLLLYAPRGDKYFYAATTNAALALFESAGSTAQLVFPESTSNDQPFWYERRTQTLWFSRDDVLMTTTFDGSGWAAASASSAGQAVTWVSPDGCRLYGHRAEGDQAVLGLRRRLRPD